MLPIVGISTVKIHIPRVYAFSKSFEILSGTESNHSSALPCEKATLCSRVFPFLPSNFEFEEPSIRLNKVNYSSARYNYFRPKSVIDVEAFYFPSSA